ncbi:ATP-dependent DNA helicase [Vandammella animalimorsus]|uniref:ATP-dependent DNA helicase n=1 Tax=Vandammella animalimorsus TaxID=2029117 RepID=A0A3M6RUC5_9BURK|nr:ATP-binding protein [Vandammella animalimorsus]RMX18484.1 ATP-dependent DNA helicase [Vandammella animalimorsus]
MSLESQTQDQKSLRVVTGAKADFPALAGDCVCFANAAGGTIYIGLEDDQTLPPPEQRIDPALLERVRKRIGELTVNVQVAVALERASNGGEFIALTIGKAVGVASTSDGRYLLRVGDTCVPVRGDDVLQLINERPALPWESMTSLGVPTVQADESKMRHLEALLRGSDRVKASVKEKSQTELLLHYGLADANVLTHLGVLMVGTARDRARLGTAPVVQAIKFDERGEKINKWQWDDYTLSPIELVDEIWETVSDFHELYELPDGLYRQHLPAYDKRVVRELLVNALVHRPYTQRGDIFLNLHPDRLEVVNPGRLPLGVTPQTMLHASRRRNDQLARLFHDLKLMEKEGTDSVCVSIGRRVQNPAIIKLMTKADQRFQLRPRERITLGLLATYDGLTARELAERLELSDANALHTGWMGRLMDLDLVRSSGRTQAMRYFVRPDLLKGVGLEGKTTLKRMEPYRLRALVEEDLSRYPGSSSSEVHQRVAPELAQRTIRRTLEELIAQGAVRHEGDRRWRRYWLTPKGQSE